MIGSSVRKFVSILVSICLLSLPMTQFAQAAVISTETAIRIDDRVQQVERVNELLARESVQSVMISLGVDPSDASSRVESLTAAELKMLEENLETLPAGGTGVVEVVGSVAIVLIVLELLNDTNFFTEF